MIESLHYLDCNFLCFITGTEQDEELQIISNHLLENNRNVILANSNRNCCVFNQVWGVVWAINNNVVPRYVCFIDDDVEFTENSEYIIGTISNLQPFSIAALANSACLYENNSDISINPTWLDECGLFVNFDDCVNYGVRDSQPEAPWIFYTGIEYQHRLRYLTGKPSISISDKIYYKHHQRVDVDMQEVRKENAHEAFYYASRFWKDKFNIDLNIDPIGIKNLWENLWNICTANGFKHNFKKHLVFENEWTDWKKIYNNYSVEILRMANI